MTLDTTRLSKITVLDSGGHSPDSHYCLMEAVAYVAGEAWSDRPACVSPCLAAYGRALNDAMPTKQRQRLIPLIPRLIGTAQPELEQQRAYLLADVAMRVLAPMALRSAHLDDDAGKLEALPPIIDKRSARAAADAAYAAADAAAYAAARAAARAAAYAAADAADAAARAAAYAAYAAYAAPWDVAIAAFEHAIDLKVAATA